MTGGDRSQRKTNCKLIQTDAERKKELVLPLRLCLQRHVVLRGIGPLCFLFSDVLPPFLQQFPKTNTYYPHSAEGLTEKRISSKVRKNAEGRKSVTRSGVSNGKTGSFGNSGRGLPRSRNSRVLDARAGEQRRSVSIGT